MKQKEMRVIATSYFPEKIKGAGWVFSINFLPQIEFNGIVNNTLKLAWLFWEIEIQGRNVYD